MKKNLQVILFCLIMLIGGPAAFSQGFEVETDRVTSDFSVDLSDTKLRLEMYLDLTNSGTDTLRLKWFRTVISEPNNWETEVCDNNRCWLSQVYSNYDEDLGVFEEMVLPPDSTYELILYVIPNGQAGSANYHLDFSFIDNPDSIVANVSFDATVSSSVTSTYAPEELKDVYVYPNPVNSSFRIANDIYVDQVEIRNMLGRRVKLFKSYSGAQYDVLDLPQGVYLIRLIDQENDIIKTMRMSKHSFKP